MRCRRDAEMRKESKEKEIAGKGDSLRVKPIKWSQWSLTGGPRSGSGPRRNAVRTQIYSQLITSESEILRDTSILTGAAFFFMTNAVIARKRWLVKTRK